MCFFFAMNMMVASNALLEHSTLYPFANNKMMIDTIVSTSSMTTISCAKSTENQMICESLIEMLPNECAQRFSASLSSQEIGTLCVEPVKSVGLGRWRLIDYGKTTVYRTR